ncbi:MAG TPA: response regulator, partial [Pseudomonas sp.]|nr:response regulator [Pseudomonas sp.]
RPEGYDVTYWHLAGVDKGAPAVMGETVSLLELMRREGLSDEEFALLREAQNNSDQLVNLERQAFAAMKGLFIDGQGNFSVKGPADRDMALGLLYGERYLNEKARIMAPLKRFKTALEQRTEAELRLQQDHLQGIIVLAMSLTGLALFGVFATLRHARSVLLLPLEQLGQQAAGIARGDYAARCEIPGDNELGELGEHFNNLASSLGQSREEEAVRDWFKSGQFELNAMLRGDRPIVAMAGDVLQFLASYLEAGVGALYVYEPQQEQLELVASYAFTRRKALSQTIVLGEGLAGEAAREKKTICWQQVPADFLPIESALGQSAPAAVVAVPLLHDDQLVGLIELGRFAGFSDRQLEFLARAAEIIAIAMSVSQSRQRVNDLLSTTQMQAEELQRTSTYKSEFLANMSHELRTPLNSMLILSNLLKQNKDGNLSAKQLEYAATIHGSGKDLLNLINDILDLSKIEAGQLQYSLEQVPLSELVEPVQALFAPVAEDRGLGFSLELEDGLPASLHTDLQRSQQVLKNLLGNAFQFTERGQVRLRIYRAAADNPLALPALAFAVSDSGIGIAADQLEHIFQAFKQADGATNRQYGGTGLGLSISRQLARGLGGDVKVHSQPGQGSTFTFYLPSGIPAGALPLARAELVRPAAAPSLPPQPLAAELADDRAGLQPGSRSILIIEDDQTFAGILRDRVREQGFAALVAVDGESGISLASQYLPSAILLDVMLPHVDGWGVMRCLQGNPATRHIPVHFLTCLDERQKALSMGAIGFTSKPVSAEQLELVLQAIGATIDKGGKRLLIVEDDANEARSLALLLESQQVEISIARSGAQALQLLAQQGFDCMVLDLGLSDMSGFELLERLSQLPGPPQLPVIVHSGRDLNEAEELKLRHYAESIIVKGARSPERLLNEVSLFLHLLQSALPADQQQMIRQSLEHEASFERRKVLLVDDDIRNIFSLASVLGEKGVAIVEASNGQEALQRLDEHPDLDLVLMDIMMPGMDGYETIRRIRQDPRFRRLPIIALTAKAMPGDQRLCLEAGASDYIPKPVELDRLFSLMRVWLYQGAD